MKITITDFGPIKRFEFNMEKSFIGIFGKNNAGKSYSISAVYLVIKNILDVDNELKFYPGMIDKAEKMAHNLGKMYGPRKRDHHITKRLEKYISDLLISAFVDRLDNSFFSTFNDLGNLKNESSENHPKITLNSGLLKVVFVVKNHVELDSVKLKKEVILRNIKTNRNLKVDKNTIVLYASSENREVLHKNCIEFMRMAISSLGDDVKNYVDNIYFLPASRSGLYQALSAFSQIFAELAQKRGFLVKKFEIPNISEPLSDYFLRLSQISRHPKPYHLKYKTGSIVEEIEKDILKGEVLFDDDNKKMWYVPDDLNIRLDVSMTSSMVSEISPIVSYLKYIIPEANIRNYRGRIRLAKRKLHKPLIFIEEPEAHLHPRVQIQLMEIFGKLSKLNVKIVITSHSNYMFNKMNNMILAKKLHPKDIEVLVFDEPDGGSTVNTAEIDELGIEDNNFLDVAEDLYEEKIDLIEKINGDE